MHVGQVAFAGLLQALEAAPTSVPIVDAMMLPFSGVACQGFVREPAGLCHASQLILAQNGLVQLMLGLQCTTAMLSTGCTCEPLLQPSLSLTAGVKQPLASVVMSRAMGLCRSLPAHAEEAMLYRHDTSPAAV